MTGSATKQSILSSRGAMDCFACARNDEGLFENRIGAGELDHLSPCGRA
jgi:hypothetical protein